MPGRYQFSLPERPSRDGWFRVGTLDVTTTALLVGLGIASMFWYAVDPGSLSKLAYVGRFGDEGVRQGELWRLVTWPIVNPPDSIWVLLTFAFFWFVGHRIEDQIGRRRFTNMVIAMTIIPAACATVFSFSALSGQAYGLGILSIALLVVFAFDSPQAMWFFNIPLWVIASAFVAIDILAQLGQERYGTLVVELGAIIVGTVTARQYGMLSDLTFIPRFGGAPRRSQPQRRAQPQRRPKAKGSRDAKGASPVVAGPWNSSAADQAELDALLDKISANGMDALSRDEKARLNELSKRLRGN